jgi:hypothetical protein
MMVVKLTLSVKSIVLGWGWKCVVDKLLRAGGWKMWNVGGVGGGWGVECSIMLHGLSYIVQTVFIALRKSETEQNYEATR